MSVAAIIPHWNRRDLLLTLLPNLAPQGFDEILVVDNGSTDDSREIAAGAGTRVIALPTNLGFAAAVNRGIAATTAEWVAILNNDVELEPGWLAALLDSAEARGAWFATGKILSAADPHTIDGAFDELSRAGCACRCGSGKPDEPYWNQPRDIRMAPMTAAIFRRALFDEAGGLDEQFGSYLEDVEFGLRCACLDRKGIYVPQAVARHQGSATSGAWRNNTVRLIARNQILLTEKHFPHEFRWQKLAGQLLWGAVALRHGAILGYLSGKWLGWKEARGIRPWTGAQRSVTTVLAESERQIWEVQRKTGWDEYWRAYFWLSPL